MDIKPCPLCGCGSGNDEGDCFPIADEYKRWGHMVWRVTCQNPECMAASVGSVESEAIYRWNNGDVV